ncbi:MAG: hypothetical protein D4S01_08010 [Dehalococcoidia bacterium]|nr:MAG: hypothetical protein D4S01_08010 [Dehalococcoidia bacterium]
MLTINWRYFGQSFLTKTHKLLVLRDLDRKMTLKRFKPIIILFLVLVFPLMQVSSAYSVESTAQDIALAFIENALPVDMSKYKATFTKQSQTTNYSGIILSQIVQYTLESEESILVVNCYVKNNVLTGCTLKAKEGQVISDRSYPNLIDAANGFLEKYQTYTKRDSTEMINTLANADTTKNSTVTAGNIKLTISNKVALGDEKISLRWFYTVNGTDYTSLKISFQNGVFRSLRDNRGVYTIGDTSVNVSKEQAIANAMNRLESYSYPMPGGVKISDFNVTEERTTAELRCAVRNSSVLYPFWNVKLFLNQTYPGNINAFMVKVWADSGEVHSIGHTGPGGGIPPVDTSDSESTPSAEEDTKTAHEEIVELGDALESESTLSAEGNNHVSSPVDILVVGTAVAIIAVVAMCAVLVKRRKK